MAPAHEVYLPSEAGEVGTNDRHGLKSSYSKSSATEAHSGDEVETMMEDAQGSDDSDQSAEVDLTAATASSLLLASPARKLRTTDKSSRMPAPIAVAEEDDESWFTFAAPSRQVRKPLLVSPARRLAPVGVARSHKRRSPLLTLRDFGADDSDDTQQLQLPSESLFRQAPKKHNIGVIGPANNAVRDDPTLTSSMSFLRSPAKKSVARSLFGPVAAGLHDEPVARKPNSPLKQSPRKVQIQRQPLQAAASDMSQAAPGSASLLSRSKFFKSPAKKGATNLFQQSTWSKAGTNVHGIWEDGTDEDDVDAQEADDNDIDTLPQQAVASVARPIPDLDVQLQLQRRRSARRVTSATDTNAGEDEIFDIFSEQAQMAKDAIAEAVVGDASATDAAPSPEEGLLSVKDVPEQHADTALSHSQSSSVNENADEPDDAKPADVVIEDHLGVDNTSPIMQAPDAAESLVIDDHEASRANAQQLELK
ncbi:hypothetical protein KEM52_005475, partial [Ascosphaera acerosa]